MDRVLSEGRVPGYLGRILGPGRTPVGTCFQVAPGLLVTAWHVLADLGCVGTGSRVLTDALNAGVDEAYADVVAADPLCDLAVLRRSAPLPGTISGWLPTDAVEPFTQVIVTGVAAVDDPGRDYRYLDSTGTWSGGTVRNDDVALGRLSSSSLMPGMSGAPVLRRDGRHVIGVVTARYNSADGWLRDSVWVARTEDLTRLVEAVPEVGTTGVRTRLSLAEGVSAVSSVVGRSEEPSATVVGPLEAALEAAMVLRALDDAARGAPGPGLAEVVEPLLARSTAGARDVRDTRAFLRRVRLWGIDARLLLPDMDRHEEARRRWATPPPGREEAESAEHADTAQAAFLGSLRRILARELSGPLFSELSGECRAYLVAGLTQSDRQAALPRFLQALEGFLPPLRPSSVEAVLVGTPSGDAGAGTGAWLRRQESTSIAAQMCGLPAPDPGTAGREELVARVAEALSRRLGHGSGVTAFLSGQPGVGTSTVAIETARRLVPAFPDGVCYIDLHGLVPGSRRDARTAVRLASGALGLETDTEPLDDAALFAAFAARLADRHVLLVLDNAKDAAHVEPLVSGLRAGAVIVTSRDRAQSYADPGLVFEVPPLERAASVEVLARCGVAHPADPSLVGRLAHLCADVPLALRMVAARQRNESGLHLAYLVQLLEEESGRLDYLEAGDRAVRMAIALSYDALDPATRSVFRLLAAAPGAALTGDELGHCMDTPAYRQERLLNRLVDRSLARCEIVRLSNGRVLATFSHHELVRLFAAERLAEEDSPETVRTFQRRSVTHLRARIEVEEAGSASPLGELDPARIHAALRLAEEQGWLDLATGLAAALHVLYTSLGELDALEDVNRTRIALHLRRGEPAEAVRACLLNATTLRGAKAPAQAGAAAREAVRLTREHRLPASLLGDAEFTHSLALWDLEEWSPALRAGERAVSAFTLAGMGAAATTVAINNAKVARQAGDLVAAREWGRKATELADRWGGGEHRAHARNVHGRALLRDHPDAALGVFRPAAALWESMEHWSNAGVEYGNAANAAENTRDWAEAIRLRMRAVDMWERAGGSPDQLAESLVSLSAHHATVGDEELAAATLDRAVRVVAHATGAGSLIREEVLVRHVAAELCCADGRPVPDLPDPPEESQAEAVAPELRRARGVLRDHHAGAVSRAGARARLRGFLRSAPLHPPRVGAQLGVRGTGRRGPAAGGADLTGPVRRRRRRARGWPPPRRRAPSRGSRGRAPPRRCRRRPGGARRAPRPGRRAGPGPRRPPRRRGSPSSPSSR